jgi:hypothetical protein
MNEEASSAIRSDSENQEETIKNVPAARKVTSEKQLNHLQRAREAKRLKNLKAAGDLEDYVQSLHFIYNRLTDLSNQVNAIAGAPHPKRPAEVKTEAEPAAKRPKVEEKSNSYDTVRAWSPYFLSLLSVTATTIAFHQLKKNVSPQSDQNDIRRAYEQI